MGWSWGIIVLDLIGLLPCEIGTDSSGQMRFERLSMSRVFVVRLKPELLAFTGLTNP
jgi:hypothetical protein